MITVPSPALSVRRAAPAGMQEAVRQRSAPAALPATFSHSCLCTVPLLERVLEIDDVAHVEGAEELLQHGQVRIELLQLVEVEVAPLFVAHEQVHFAEKVVA